MHQPVLVFFGLITLYETFRAARFLECLKLLNHEYFQYQRPSYSFNHPSKNAPNPCLYVMFLTI